MKYLFMPNENHSLRDLYEIVFDAHLEGVRNGLLSKPDGKHSFAHARTVVTGLFLRNAAARNEKRIKDDRLLTETHIFETMMEAVECGYPFLIEDYRVLQDDMSDALYPEEHGQNAE